MKKRLSKLALLAVAAAVVLAGFPACSDEDEDPPPPVLKEILVETAPTKATYTVGETLDPDGLVVKEVYSNSVTIDVPYSEDNKDDFTFEGFDSSKPNESVTVTVTYKEMTATFTVSVAGTQIDPTKTLDSIAVKTPPTKVAYTVGDTLDPAGLVITVTYDDGSSTPIAYSEANKDDFTFAGFDASAAGEITVTVTYKEKTATFTVSVAATEVDPTKTIDSIAVTTPPTKAAYMVGDTALDPAGLVITVSYDDGSSTPIAYSEANKDDFTFAGFDASAASESVTVMVKYKGMTATFTVSVAEAEKSLFETLSAQENNILAEDFATASTVSPFGAGFGLIGVYGADGVTVTDGAISTGSGTNRKIHVDFGPVKETVEGCVTLTVGGTQPQSGKSLLTFYNGDTAFLTIKTGTGDNTVGGTAGTYEIYYKFDLTAKTVSLKVNDTDVLTDSALTADSVSGYTIESHNGGKGTVAADNIAVCATKGDLSTYKAQVKAWLATLVTNSYSEEKGYTTNKAAVDLAKSTGDTTIDAATDIAAVLTAYGNAKTALGQVKNDLKQAQENACTELDAYFPTDKTADSYTEEQLKAVTAAKEAGKTAINAATSVEAVNAALAEAKANIDKLPDSTMTAYTVTVITNEGTTLGTVTAYTTVASVLDEIKELAANKNKVIADDKFYSEQGCTTDYDTATTLTSDVTVYVKLEEKKTTTYVLDVSTVTFTITKEQTSDTGAEGYATIDGMKFEVLGGKNKSLPDAQGSSKIKVVNMQSGVKTDSNCIKFTTTQKSSVTVNFFHDKADRYIKILNANGKDAGTGTEKTTADGSIKETIFTDLSAGTYYLGSASSGIYISKVTVTTE